VTAWAVLAAITVGVAVGELWFRRRRRGEYLRGVLAGQWQSDLTHSPRLNVSEQVPVPEPRRRSPDLKQEQQPAPLERAVFHRTR
jgi:hypothetical protein